MLHVHGIQGRVFSGTLEQLRQRQAPVLDAHDQLVGLVGLVGLAALSPPASAQPPDAVAAAAERARLARPVSDAMWSPVPAAAPETDLRRVAALVLDTGLPGLPVAADAGRLLGFVSRTDLLRALAHDPPLDLWG